MESYGKYLKYWILLNIELAHNVYPWFWTDLSEPNLSKDTEGREAIISKYSGG